MRCTPVLILFGSLIVLIHSRPYPSDNENDSGFEASDYAENKSDDDSPARDRRIQEHPENGYSQGGGIDVNKLYTYDQGNIGVNRAELTTPDISDLKPYGNQNFRDKVEDYADPQTYSQHRLSKYTENIDLADQPDVNPRLPNRNTIYPKSKRIHNNMLIDDAFSKIENGLKKEYPNIQGEMLFGTRGQADKNEFINEPLELSKPYSRYYGPVPPANKDFVAQGTNREVERMYYNRERRETNDANPDPVSNYETEKDSENDQNEDQETAIKRHIKKLSSDELEELLNSLSDEKKQLLKSIMEYNDLAPYQNDAVNKREITKKAGAVEENSCIVNGQSDSNISGESVANDSDEKTTESALQNNLLNNTTPSSGKVLDTQPDTNPDNSAEKVLLSVEAAQQNVVHVTSGTNSEKDTASDETTDEKPDVASKDEKTPAEIVPSDDKLSAHVVPSELNLNKVTTKNENKRETNINDLADIVSFEDSKIMDNDFILEDSKDQCSCSQDENFSQLIDDDQPLSNDGSKVYKREIQNESDYDSKMKSLEESFPKSSNYDELAGPLIRVKRKAEPAIKKRSAALVPDAKVSFFPYRAENEDEDNDEGNEFDDDGFYERSPNFSDNDKSNSKDPPVDSFDVGRNGPFKEVSKDASNHGSDTDSVLSVSKDASNLGSDTDSVLSGVEGEDENIMFSSGSRSRRTTDEIPDTLDESNSIHNLKSQNDESKALPNINNIITYQESDSFGPLPIREGESGRYKRIRRVKQYQPDPV